MEFSVDIRYYLCCFYDTSRKLAHEFQIIRVATVSKP